MFRNIATELFRYDSVRTTDTRAKEIKRVADKLVSLAKNGSLHARRKAASYIRDKDVLKKLFNELAERYKDRPGGYTRIIKLGYRKGDNSPISMIELVQEEYKPKATKKKTKTKSAKKEESGAKQEKNTKSKKKESAKDLGLTEETEKTEEIEAAAENKVEDRNDTISEEQDITAKENQEDTTESQEAEQEVKAEKSPVESEDKTEDASADDEKKKK